MQVDEWSYNNNQPTSNYINYNSYNQQYSGYSGLAPSMDPNKTSLYEAAQIVIIKHKRLFPAITRFRAAANYTISINRKRHGKSQKQRRQEFNYKAREGIIMGITFLAAGTSIPDAYASIHVARQHLKYSRWLLSKKDIRETCIHLTFYGRLEVDSLNPSVVIFTKAKHNSSKVVASSSTNTRISSDNSLLAVLLYLLSPRGNHQDIRIDHLYHKSLEIHYYNFISFNLLESFTLFSFPAQRAA
uniref:Uncharacterized protein n=1 Tax=Tetranychus urticae TaxID=32264 RepID=T1L3C5_TETUR